MASCLGLYIEENLIKYAKVTKEHDNIKVEAFGVKFYENLNEAINQILSETYSFKTAISINLSNENYLYFNMFALLNKNDLQKAINTEFESYCADKGYNPNGFETRYAVATNKDEKDKLKIIHVSSNKVDLTKRIKQLQGNKLINISPVPMSIPNLVQIKEKDNVLIVNIEEKTTITTILDEKITKIDIVEQGSRDFLDKIFLKENSYAKAYDICKNTTIYTSEGTNLQEVQTTNLEDIMPTLYEIVTNVKKIIEENLEKINKIYITGTGALINNIDLYFEEYLQNVKCEILKPYFVQHIRNINIKDYVEVNSALTLALMGLHDGISGMNFKKTDIKESISGILKTDISFSKGKAKRADNKLSGILKFDLGEKLDTVEKNLLRIPITLLIFIIIYSGFSVMINNQIAKKDAQAEESIKNTREQINLVSKDNSKIKSKTNEYTTLIKNLEEINNKISETTKTRNAIPNLLNQIMYLIPQGVQITSIENTSDKHITIIAKSEQYEQLGYFRAILKTENVLTNVISSAGEKESNIVTVKIEGDLP